MIYRMIQPVQYNNILDLLAHAVVLKNESNNLDVCRQRELQTRRASINWIKNVHQHPQVNSLHLPSGECFSLILIILFAANRRHRRRSLRHSSASQYSIHNSRYDTFVYVIFCLLYRCDTWYDSRNLHLFLLSRLAYRWFTQCIIRNWTSLLSFIVDI